FGNSASVVGESFKLNGKTTTIIGVMAPGFNGFDRDSGRELFLPLNAMRFIAADTRPLRAPFVIGRLAPHATIAEARAELASRWPAILQATMPAGLSAADRQAQQAQRLEMESAAVGISGLRRQYGTSVVISIGLAAILLAIASINLAGLMLARWMAEHH